jgi:hypothetical protein
VRAAREIFLNGFEARLPDGLFYKDPDGHERADIRLAWWRPYEEELDYRSAAFVADQLRERIPQLPLPPDVVRSIRDQPPGLFAFGHYWLDSPLQPLSPRHVCVDASIAKKGGRLAAYRYSGEQAASADHFVYVG